MEIKSAMFKTLQQITARPEPFSAYTADLLWTEEHIAKQMLAFHLDPDGDISSRNAAFIESAVDWMATRFRIGLKTEIADFGCGPGLYCTPLAARGARVTGIDFSVSSLAHARKIAEEKNLDIDYIEANYLDFETDRKFDLIAMIYCDLCPLSPEQRKRMFAKFRAMLKAEGRLLLDVFSLARFDSLKEGADFGFRLMDGFWAEGGYYGFSNSFKYEAEKLSLDKYTIIEPGRTRRIMNWLQHFSPDSLTAELAENGFAVEDLLGDVAGANYNEKAPSFAVVARKN